MCNLLGYTIIETAVIIPLAPELSYTGSEGTGLKRDDLSSPRLYRLEPEVCHILRSTQRDSKNPRLFEEALAKAFQFLGLNARRVGGSNMPDVVVKVSAETGLAEAKTTASGSISEAYVNFAALDRYRKKWKAKHLIIVGPVFSKGNLPETAEKKKMSLVTTEAVCRAVANHSVLPYNCREIFRILFASGKPVVTAKDITYSLEGGRRMERRGEIIRRLLSEECKPRKGSFTAAEMYEGWAEWAGLTYSKDEIEAALKFLSSPPLSVLTETDGRYSYTITPTEAKKKFRVLFEALGDISASEEEVPPISTGTGARSRPTGKTHVTAGDFDHRGKGVFRWRTNPSVEIDVHKQCRHVEEALAKHGLWNKCMLAFTGV